ncbi:Tfp pilus assembly protein PilN [Collimonas sp. OK307]|uniref:PilN domain-containing protein n=1 Tax=Collimonas sp. OK307 TaxID=1801620 RepID=UPI0008F14D40|nr:PilN domain-containing protein [Collimonas sp. OK307]SFI02018.1 Tfp pilus assembly protein PilN [Collimonas sp. OK307]
MASLQKLDFDFSVQRRKLPPFGLAILLAGAAASIYAGVELSSAYNARKAQQTVYDALVSRLHTVRHADQDGAKITPAELQNFKNAAQIAGQLNTPWDRLLKVLESAPMEHVALLSVEPVASRRQLHLVGEAKDFATMLDYLSYLQSQPGLQRVILTSHQIQTQPGSPVRFQIQAHWEEK